MAINAVYFSDVLTSSVTHILYVNYSDVLGFLVCLFFGKLVLLTFYLLLDSDRKSNSFSLHLTLE